MVFKKDSYDETKSEDEYPTCRGGNLYTVSIDAVYKLTGRLHQGGLSRVSIASHVNTTDSKKHLGTDRSLYQS